MNFYMGNFISEFSQIRKTRIYFSAVPSTEYKNLEYIRNFVVSITAILENINLLGRFKFRDSKINWKLF
jgi:hypothetical protein